jgi:hypothetical protein
VTDPADPRFGGLDPALVRAVAAAIADRYRPDGDDWFDQIRRAAVSLGFAPIALGPDEVLRRIYALGGQREAGTMAP